MSRHEGTLVLFGIVSLALSGCATVFTGTSQTVNIQAVDEHHEPLEGATCVIRDGEGAMWVVPSNPGAVIIPKGNAPLMPECKKEGYSQKTFAIGDSFSAATIANVLFWPGFIVDAMTGSMKKYPSYINVLMEAESKPAEKSAGQLPPAGETYGPDGRKAYSIQCNGHGKDWQHCYASAGSICKTRGYDIVSKMPEDDSGLGDEKMRAILVSCRVEAADSSH